MAIVNQSFVKSFENASHDPINGPQPNARVASEAYLDDGVLHLSLGDLNPDEPIRVRVGGSEATAASFIAMAGDQDEPPAENRPDYYKHGDTECGDIAESMPYWQGTAFAYLWRAGKKGDAIDDLVKARTCITKEIARLERLKAEQ